MKEKKALPVPWLMVSLSMLIVGAGIAVGFLIQSLLPSYKNTIITVTDVPEIKQMLYVENTEELIIFPWDQYDPDTCISLEEYFKQASSMDEEKITFESFKEWMNREIYVKSKIDSLEKELDFSQALKIDPNSNRFFLKDFSYVDSTKTPCTLDLAWDQDGIWSRDGQTVYRHISRQSEELLLPSTLEAAYEHLDNMFASADKILQQMENDVVYYEIYSGSNPLLRWYGEVLGSKYQEGKYSHLLYWLADKKNCETIVYRNEILLVYDLDESKRIVLFYDPFFQRMNGYSLNL